MRVRRHGGSGRLAPQQGETVISRCAPYEVGLNDAACMAASQFPGFVAGLPVMPTVITLPADELVAGRIMQGLGLGAPLQIDLELSAARQRRVFGAGRWCADLSTLGTSDA